MLETQLKCHLLEEKQSPSRSPPKHIGCSNAQGYGLIGYSDHGRGDKGDGRQCMSHCSSQQSPDQEPNAQPILSPPGKPTGSTGILGCNWQGRESHEWKEKGECFKIYTYLFFFFTTASLKILFLVRILFIYNVV